MIPFTPANDVHEPSVEHLPGGLVLLVNLTRDPSVPGVVTTPVFCGTVDEMDQWLHAALEGLHS